MVAGFVTLRIMTCTRSIAARVRSHTELFRYFPPTDGPDIWVWMRAAATDEGLDPNRCALVTMDSAKWREDCTRRRHDPDPEETRSDPLG
jgi:hypothetical protein